MKFYFARPVEELRTVKPDADDAHYEFYVMIPVRIGAAKRIRPQKVETDDGGVFVNLQSAAMHYLRKWEQTNPNIKNGGSNTAKVRGMEIVKRGKWAAFCKLRKISADSPEHVIKEYELTTSELTELGLLEGLQ